MISFDGETEDKIVDRFKELDSNGEVNNKFHYLKGAYDQSGEEYTDDSLLITACLAVMCKAVSDNSTQDASKLFNEAANDAETGSYLASLMNKAIDN